MNSLNKKLHIYAQLMPYNLKIALAFYPEETINDIQFFIEETMKKYRTKYKVGRIEKKSNSSWLLPQYKINEFLQEGDEITVYTCEYGLTKTNLTNGTRVEDIDVGFIGKKSKRKQGEEEIKSKDSNNGVVKKIMKDERNYTKNNQSAKKGEKEKKQESDDEEEMEESKSENEEKEESEEEDNNDNEENEENEDVSSGSGEDKDEDLDMK